MSNDIIGHISGIIMSKILAQAVISQAASRCPEIIESRDQGEMRFLAFATASADRVDEAIDRLKGLSDRLGHVDTKENMDEFMAAINKEVKFMVDAGLAAFNNTPQYFQAEPSPGQPVH